MLFRSRDAVVNDAEEAYGGSGFPKGLSDGGLVRVAEIDDGHGVGRRRLGAHSARCGKGRLLPSPAASPRLRKVA